MISGLHYCPKCLNDSLSINSRGTIHVIVNGKQMDAGRFLFNVGKQDKEQIKNDLEEKLADFFKWYKEFHNKEPITKVDIVSSDFKCEKGCRLDMGYRSSVNELLFSGKELKEILVRMSEKYKITLDL